MTSVLDEPMTDDEIDQATGGVPVEDVAPVDAPYGYKADGTPRKRPPTRGPEAQGKGAPAPKRKPTRTARSSKDQTNYEENINGISQLFVMGLFAAPGKATSRDAVTIAEHGPNIARALQLTADQKPEVAALLDRFLAVGPYGVLAAAVLPMAVQLASNHGAVPTGTAKMMGARPPDEMDTMAAQMTAQMRPSDDEEV